MLEQKIMMIWRENGEKHEKQISRKNLLELMDSIKENFYWDNEISTILVKMIPQIVSIEIDKDRNNEKDVPFIYCKLDNNEGKLIEIIRHHKIIWSILNKLCEE